MFCCKIETTEKIRWLSDYYPVDTGRKLNVHKTSWTSSERLMYVQFTSCVYGVVVIVRESKGKYIFQFVLNLLNVMTLRVRSHERRNELKPVWDFISVENLISVFSQLFTCVHMNWSKMKLKTVWTSYRSFWPKWNFKPAWDFHVNIIFLKQNE